MAARDSEGRLLYQCIFCTKGIDWTDLDPCAVVLTAKWDRPDNRWQQFWCHAACFQERAQGYADIEVFHPEYYEE
jgi:hypothetical protein